MPNLRRTFSGAAISRSAVTNDDWRLVIDAFDYTEEAADIAEVVALNALLSMPVVSGFELEFPD